MALPKENEKKVERAFAVIEKLEKNHQTGNNAAEPQKNMPLAPRTVQKSGLHVHFALDAMLSESDSQKTGEKDLRAGQSKLLDIRFTVPYIWQIPVIGSTALKFVKYFQSEKHAESVRDILQSLQRNKKR